MLVGFRAQATGGINLKNAVLVNPGDDLAAKYAWLKSSDRNAVMGTLASSNRRSIILAPGKHTLTVMLTLDTDYVDVVCLSGNPKDTFVVADLATEPVVKQTANTIALVGFTIQNDSSAGGCKGFYQDAVSSNANSEYHHMEFYCPNQGTSYPVMAESNESGTWEFYKAGNKAWRMENAGTWGPTMRYCKAGLGSFGGDVIGGILVGVVMDHCEGGDESFGGCGGRGLQINNDCYFYDCKSGQKSFAMGIECKGNFFRCEGGDHCFGGYSGSGSMYGKFNGYAKDCTAGGNSFGMGAVTAPHTKCYISGRIENCLLGDRGRYAAGILDETGQEEIYDQSAAAAVTTALAGSNNDLNLTMKKVGIWGKNYQLLYEQTGTGKPLGSVVITKSVTTNKWQIKVRISSGVTLASEVKNWLQTDADTKDLVTVSYADGDGSGAVSVMAARDFTGGADTPFFRNNFPWIPTACIANQTVRAFDSGHTFTNAGQAASTTITFSLPAALAGMKYKFCRVDYDADKDIRIDPSGTEHIYLEDGSDCGAGKYRGNDTASDAYYEITVACFKNGVWRVANEKGAGATEP